MPLAEPPTIITPPSGRRRGFLYCSGVRLVMSCGRPALRVGIVAMLQAPLAMTSIRLQEADHFRHRHEAVWIIASVGVARQTTLPIRRQKAKRVPPLRPP